jgi:hypothetical protein
MISRLTLRLPGALLLACTLLLAACGGGSGSGSTSGAATGSGGSTTAYLVSDPYPVSAQQPDHFDVSCDNTAVVRSAPAVNPNGTEFLHYSLAGLAAGAHSCTVTAADASGNQSSPVQVSFTLA